MEVNSIVEKILSVVRSQAVVNNQIHTLQREHQELVNSMNRSSGKLEGLLELYQEVTGESFNDTIKRDSDLANRVQEANKLGESVSQQSQQEPRLKKEVSNRRLPERPMPTEEMEIDSAPHVLRTREPAKIVIKDEPKTAKQMKSESEED